VRHPQEATRWIGAPNGNPYILTRSMATSYGTSRARRWARPISGFFFLFLFQFPLLRVFLCLSFFIFLFMLFYFTVYILNLKKIEIENIQIKKKFQISKFWVDSNFKFVHNFKYVQLQKCSYYENVYILKIFKILISSYLENV
jgi:hypothetical protein